jgi:hypothetical protein
MDRHLRQQPESVRDAVKPSKVGQALPPANRSKSGSTDEATVAYILETRKHFEDLRQVSGQLAGLLVLAAAGSKSAGPHHPMLQAAHQLYENASEAIHCTAVPASARCHHAHLLQAAQALRRALVEARAGAEIDSVLRPLRAAYAHLQQASNELPGFDMIAFGQGCCGGSL